ncbi:bifunctional diaminohydroxyphosphoribosylaminopyrimidine deaminase/5-amino-6-(5-phosphoribosylamino)uracil reductase RibD [Chryseobacterium indoltheticum]|uniref:Riboflavin biosynthesis protein RibD n=1 Tax=Chryseobacterium indoltheticum TaxID=254 RepID=A0A381F810_9FLAO|nr:bifunctional diaminohydroxyphosphoribosylaminopyrimidine deaminase/5-amino-6-(5-phosphoribosylamino)uracil reductase RibD [Chryseobacterium indoltheticum]AZA73064.1 bifunctional diaminohydroxyphosphoribosylaminopyrimidine deaminase/5-amino-6-(5-phosphoribosylamino)uracil reductase RibD [Chryseobacterium indoltheticum]SIP92865.1 diaminohydroxyphosphoribosylaminopyrimidine deaminase [Chryseobacterium indoltheticum]SUX42675.1 Riboflavin biosynthesis protein RibD [Chryseobacterium indoltheticum]
MQEEFYIKRCIELAQKAIGNTYPNPLVGSVIVHNDKIIGEGYHHKAGENHAEINAVNSVADKSLIPESTIYVSLEPCAHFGKTPPCALKIVELGFKKVVIGAMDSHDKVNGKGKKIIQEAGIEVVSGVLEKECIELNKRFFTYHERRRPFIILKWAESGDRFMDKDFKPTQISNALTKQFVHQLRSNEHSILIGTMTALRDNPSLTTREIVGRNPIRILIDIDLKVPKDFNVYSNEAETLVFNSVKEGDEGNIKFIKTSRENFIANMLKTLHELQIQSIIVEGGSLVLQQFIDAGLWDETIIIKNKNLVLENGTKAPRFNKTPIDTRDFRDNIIEFYKNSH